MGGQYIDIVARDGGTFSAYVASPAQGSGPGLVLLQELFGINDYMKSMADRYAEEGYVVLVPDLFWRMQPNMAFSYGEADFAQALQYNERFDVETAIDEIDAALDALRIPGPPPAGSSGVSRCPRSPDRGTRRPVHRRSRGRVRRGDRASAGASDRPGS